MFSEVKRRIQIIHSESIKLIREILDCGTPDRVGYYFGIYRQFRLPGSSIGLLNPDAW